jgi:cell division protein FtsN
VGAGRNVIDRNLIVSSPNNPRPQYNPRRQHREAPKKNSKRSGASPTRRDGSSVQIPWWLWIVIGTALGVFVSFLISLAKAPAAPETVITEKSIAKTKVAEPAKAVEKTVVAASDADAKSSEIKNANAKNADDRSAKPDETKTVTKFDFYTLLPEREVIVPNDRDAVKAIDKSKATNEQQQNAQAADGEQLFLQAGSFRSAQEAERRRTQIKTLGLNAKVEEVTANADTWYRVQAGPFTSRDQLSKARDQLKTAGIESLLLRQKQN